MLKTHGYFHILASALPQSVKTGIWQVHWVNRYQSVCRKKNQNIPKLSKVVDIFADCHILTMTLPRSRKKWHCAIPYLDAVNICVYKSLSKYSVWIKTFGDFHIFTFFCFGVASGEEKWHLTSVLARSCRCLSVCEKLTNNSRRLKRYDYFRSLTTNEQTDKRIDRRTDGLTMWL